MMKVGNTEYIAFVACHSNDVHLLAIMSSMCGPCGGKDASELSFPTLRLLYFPVPGRAGAIRRILRYARIPFEDQHINFGEWSSVKPKVVTGQVPVLYVNDEPLSESVAILNYVSRLAGLVPKDPLHEAKMLSVIMAVYDLIDKVITPYYKAPPEQKEGVAADLADKVIPEGLSILERLVTSTGNNSGYCVGKELTAADFFLHCFIEVFDIAGDQFHIPFDAEGHIKKYHTHLGSILKNMKALIKDRGLS